MSTVVEPDPVAIREELQRQRAHGTPFATAWLIATGQTLQPAADSDDRRLLTFMRKHFEAAYNDDATARGRCMVPPRDTSGAVPATTFTGRDPERDAEIVADVRSGHTYETVARAFGVTKQRVSAIITRTTIATVPLPKATNDHDRCRSGDGCDRLAVRGRFGRMWCAYHAEELERLTGKLTDARSKANPRNGGNNSLYSHKAA